MQYIGVSEQTDCSCYLMRNLIGDETCQENNPIEEHKSTIRLKAHSFMKH